jgi:ribonuclease J
MAEHAALARAAGVGKVVTCRDGDMMRLAPGTPGVIDEVPSGRIYKDGALLVGAGERTVPDRRRLGFAGMISVAVAVTDRGEIVGEPEVELTGIPETDRDGNLLGRIVYDAVLDAIDSMPRARRRDPDAVAEAARRAARAAVSGVWNKKPTCHVHVLTV